MSVLGLAVVCVAYLFLALLFPGTPRRRTRVTAKFIAGSHR